MSSFFIKGNSSSKRKPSAKAKVNGHVKSAGKRSKKEVEIESDSEAESGTDIEEEAEDVETAQEKRLRLAKEYLSQLQDEERKKHADDDDLDEAVSSRLKEDVLEQSGRLQRCIAEQYTASSVQGVQMFRGHKTSVTCVALSPDERHAFSGSKDGEIIRWSIEKGKKECTLSSKRKLPVSGKSDKLTSHIGSVLCLALSHNGKYLASGGDAKLIFIWDATSLTWVHTFTGHRGAVTALSFRRTSNQLFSGSADRTVKVWSVDQMAYMETLFGHEDSVIGLDSFNRDRALTCGARDRSLRLWKIPEESQLVFRASNGSTIDCVAYINEDTFVSGDDKGELSLWSVQKKKPLFTRRRAHCSENSGDDKSAGHSQECWISTVASVPNSDLVASGSCDGQIRLWKCERGFRLLKPLFSIPVDGFVNCLRFSPSGDSLVAAVGKEHRLGRWWSRPDAKNCIVVISFKTPDEKES